MVLELAYISFVLIPFLNVALFLLETMFLGQPMSFFNLCIMPRKFEALHLENLMK